ncbi:MAG TPA: FAD-binding oxidoreductase [Elusimicrobia bacterium]|nr:MAG: hypothetical protein A2278_00605 [Elusimicrobia bacterium RIFOXYA12_FULL_49_49]OGS08829.1 MAG: hypothetical protein A2204_04160 [Elusimicrobia bacterium RIFOXYA1_FULL_47_7]OGS11005.1 MAG: hypothetical protein A2386_00300 [Elusimicrobia bacterium RIFOXYB1_FULL_48_9]OGS15158.1 MAG: hypothetical protein A2251_00615 [Elusimicrobia bacterium RIFOXYA2_FULL_47_53]OGS29778.1 MAG: hypothetical protein A2323_01415 [Elusimicrobia bacterium RIFOXYB2_FULL_46_23]HBU70260.1 FAD-binding oxidoreductase
MITKTDPDIIISYLEDYSGLKGGFADRVYLPSSSQEIAELLKDCSASRTPVTVSGAGTGVTGGRIPYGGAVVSLENLNKIMAMRKIKELATLIVQPAARVSQVKNFALINGLIYPPDPTETSSFIGGNVSTNASGSRGLKYGSTRKYVTRLKIVLTTGEILNLKRGEIFASSEGFFKVPLEKRLLEFKLPSYKLPNIKSAAGYYNYPGMDLIDLFIGHEGTLGVFTEIELKLLPSPEKLLAGIAFFSSEQSSWEFVRETRDTLKPASLEYFDHNALALLMTDYPQVPPNARAAIFFEHETTEASESLVLGKYSGLFVKYGVNPERVWLSSGARDLEAFREFRHRLPEKVNEIVKKNGFAKTGTDIAVPDAGFSEMMAYYYELLEASGIQHLIFGHIGENHMHANLLPSSETDYNKSREIYKKLAAKAIALGGTVSAEHGIGKVKHSFLEQLVGREGMLEMAGIKKAFDPACILGLDNIFPKELLQSR